MGSQASSVTTAPSPERPCRCHLVWEGEGRGYKVALKEPDRDDSNG